MSFWWRPLHHMRSGDLNQNAHGCWGHFGLHDLVHVGVLEQNGVMENLSMKENKLFKKLYTVFMLEKKEYCSQNYSDISNKMQKLGIESSWKPHPDDNKIFNKTFSSIKSTRIFFFRQLLFLKTMPENQEKLKFD